MAHKNYISYKRFLEKDGCNLWPVGRSVNRQNKHRLCECWSITIHSLLNDRVLWQWFFNKETLIYEKKGDYWDIEALDMAKSKMAEVRSVSYLETKILSLLIFHLIQNHNLRFKNHNQNQYLN